MWRKMFGRSTGRERRRRLVATLSDLPLDLEPASPIDASEPLDMLTELPVPIEQNSLDANEEPSSPQGQSDPLNLAERLQRPERIRWLFVGDSLSKKVENPLEGKTLATISAALIRERLGRGRCTFLNALASQSRLTDLLAQFDKRIEQRHPHIVVICCGPGELAGIADTSLEFEGQLHALLQRIRSINATPVINLPPRVPKLSDFEMTDALVRLEAIRACAAESDTLLVDHFQHWETSDSVEWREDDQILSEQGRQEFAELLLRETGLHNSLKTQSSPAPQREEQAT